MMLHLGFAPYSRHAELPDAPEEHDLMSMSASVPRYTAEEIRRFPDDRLRYEVIHGQLFVTPAPGTRHQRAVRELVRLLQAYLVRHHLGECLTAPFEVVFADDNAVQPDLLVVLASQRDHLTAERFHGAPSLVIEVVSYSSKRTDRLEKRELYRSEHVTEYWIVDTEARQVERWRTGDASPEIATVDLLWQPVTSVPALRIALGPLFQVIWEGIKERG
jgi:Uma2 family endonuclease